MKKQYTYDAFISYRHKELDKFVAENLHMQMEAFKLPSNVAKKQSEGRTKIERVFRDKDELPISSNLEDPIIKALQESEFLIVICTPEIRESIWCKKEIETFIQMHGRENVLAVLAKGEPHESFPEELLYRDKVITKEDGSKEVVKEPVEPLAADVRGKDQKEILKAIKAELPRLLAPMFGMSYDDLKQRHRERRLKRIRNISLAAAVLFAIFGIFSAYMALQISKQKDEIENKNMEIIAQNAEISKQAEEIRKQNEEIGKQNEALAYAQALSLAKESERYLADGDRIAAISAAMSALTECDGVKMPYTEEAQKALTESLYVYEAGRSIRPDFQLDAIGVVCDVIVSPDYRMAFVRDTSEMAALYDLEDGSVLLRFQDVNSTSTNNKTAFIGNEKVAYINTAGEVCICDIATGNTQVDPEFSGAAALRVSESGNYLSVESATEGYLQDTRTGEKVFTYQKEHFSYVYHALILESEEELLYFWAEADREENNYFYIQNLTTGKQIKINAGNYQLVQSIGDGDKIYVQMNFNNDYMSGFKTEVRCYDVHTGRQIWKCAQDGNLGRGITKSLYGKPCILAVNSWEASLIDAENGKEMEHFYYRCEITEVYAFNAAEIFGVLTRDGDLHTISVSTLEDVVSLGLFVCHSDNVSIAKQCVGGFLIASPLEDRVVKYTLLNMDLTPSENTYVSDSMIITDPVFMKEYLENHTVEEPNLVFSLFTEEESNITFVIYKNCKLRLYDEKDNLLCCLDTGSSTFNSYYGKDKDGNFYVGGNGRCYMISPDFKVKGIIYTMVALDKENNQLILTYGNNQYEVPIYTVEELLAMGREVVLRYTH